METNSNPPQDGAMSRNFSGASTDVQSNVNNGRQHVTSPTALLTACYDFSNSRNVSLSFGDVECKGCVSQENFWSRVEALKEVFVGVHTLGATKHLLEKHGHVNICGAPGDGKTSIAMMVCDEYRNQNYETLFVENIEKFEVDTTTKRRSNMLIVFDDIFGCVTFPLNLEKINSVLRVLADSLTGIDGKQGEKGIKKKKKDLEGGTESMDTSSSQSFKLRFIFTSRTYNWNEGCSRLHQYKINLFKTETVMDMTKDFLTPDEKRLLLSSFKAKAQMCDMSDEDIKTIIHSQYSQFGFPLMCSLFFPNPVFQMHNVDFFQNPVTYLRGDLDAIIRESSTRSAALILLILCEGKLNLVTFQTETGGNSTDLFLVVKDIVPFCTRTNICKEIVNFAGTYCTVEDHIASFSHPSVYDAAACALSHLNLVLLLQYCSLKFLHQRVRLKKMLQTSTTDDVTNMIYISPALYQLVVDRISEGIRQRCFQWTVTHPVLSDDTIASLLVTQLGGELTTIAQQRDKTFGKCFLYWTSLTHNEVLFDSTLKIMRRKKTIYLNRIKNLFRKDSIKREQDLYFCAITCIECGEHNKLQHITSLLKRVGKFDVNFKSTKNKTLLLIAAETGHLDVFKFLLQEQADISLTDCDGMTCLHYACKSGSKDITEVILGVSPDMINATDWMGNTAAGLSAESGHDGILKLLASRGADMTHSNRSGWCSLLLASRHGHVSAVKYLLSLDVFDINRRGGSYNQSPVMVAAKHGHFDVYNLYVSKGVDLWLVDNDKADCLMLACEGGNQAIVKHLLSLKQFDINKRAGHSQTAVMIAAEKGNYDVFKLLVSEGADLSYLLRYNLDCLMLACIGGNLQIVKHLLSMETFDINRRGGWYSQTSVMMAAESGHYDVYALLVSEGADVSPTTGDRGDCLILACYGGNVSIVKHILSLNTFNINRKSGWRNETPLMVAIMEGHFSIYTLLVSEGANLTVTDDFRTNMLMLACEGGNLSIVKHLLAMNIFDINSSGGQDNKDAVMFAVESGHYEVFELLVSEGAKLSGTQQYNKDCLMLACAGGNVNIVKYLLSTKSFDVNKKGGWNNSTPVMMAARRGYYDVYHLLVSEGADLSLANIDNQDILMAACKGGNLSIIKHLLSLKNVDVNKQGGHKLQTPVMLAAENGNASVFDLLVSEGADLTLSDVENRNCLILACLGGNISIVKHLLSLNIFDINRSGGKYNQTPLMVASEKLHHHVYDVLVSEGADLSCLSGHLEHH
ncbi:alpha-latroinsectotoxin-Lt1a-like [Haliotis cracherodii]|uniref:alpha-latroinsectotoxin-Lt1a-like n=1 Tax=Haliotis cracherodii TaxID=6455 RepID=UPI0039EB5536